MSVSQRESNDAIHPPLTTPDVFTDPTVFEPKLQHCQTFIILHGRGSFAARFAPTLLATTTTENETIQSAFPHARLIFPTASRNRATIYKRSYTHQWFDNWHLNEHTKRQELMGKGLNKSCKYIHKLLSQEIELVGAENVVLWGLSQGCATCLASLLAWDSKPFAAVVGMCGYLPFADVVQDMASGGSCTEEEEENPFGSDDDDVFANSGDEGDRTSAELGNGQKVDGNVRDAIEYFREEIGMTEKRGMVYQEVPIYLGHGSEDKQVGIDFGRDTKEALMSIGAGVEMVEYPGLGHWYSADMLTDIFSFLRKKLPAVAEKPMLIPVLE
ncbi:hypothetical protein QTJ16_002288 [Diplocarpon rosae]|uniref:Phospholipase/carboxylesterase/thioesterase domain-containing protein n=1 Tax=Diplocarpon rosae TaxID=946125 RepID=A0AAD9T207_9HELO|nr:hypothetical protein QTJ16_002288 [Diplocarpon rosae]